MENAKRIQLLVTFGYDGAPFHGLQPQPGLPTAGGALRARFEDAGVTPKALCYAARTDAGVHARRNIATLWLRGPADVDGVIAEVTDGAAHADGLTDVTVYRVPINVHARATARGKHYRYLIEHGCEPGAADSTDAWQVAPRLDPAAMHEAAQALIGEHDFSSLRTRRGAPSDPVRHLDRIDVVAAAGQGWPRRLTIDIQGKSFLRQMVRIIAGTLAEVGAGLRRPGEMEQILAARRRGAAGPTAPAHGLTLVQVFTEYPLPPLGPET